VDDTIRYLNTDVDLASGEDLTALAAALEARGVFSLHVTRAEDGSWDARFETDADHTEPQASIAAMIAVVESLPAPLRTVWSGCTRREFNVGYDCGGKPWAFSQALSGQLLGRMAAAGASLRITLYPPGNKEEPID
jgi:hypothetical protein